MTTCAKHMLVVAAAVVSFLLGGCAVHEWPREDYGPAEFRLKMNFDLSLPLYREIIYTRSDDDSRASDTARDIRYTVQAFRSGEVRSGTRTQTNTYVFTRPADADPNCELVITIDEGVYDFYVWADYTDADSSADKYYSTSDFGCITLFDREHHAGSTDFREAFRGSVTAAVTNPDRYAGGPRPENSAEVDMVRPMGRYEFVSTDVELFLSRVAAMRGAEAAAAGDDATRSVDLSEFRVVFSYNAWMPCSFNMFTDKPSDSWTGVSFDSTMELREDGMLLGFDYVFVNGSETLMNLRVDVYNDSGECIASTPSVEVPVVRSKLTTVRGEFLTVNASGGVAVNPDYEGPDYNIEIH